MTVPSASVTAPGTAAPSPVGFAPVHVQAETAAGPAAAVSTASPAATAIAARVLTAGGNAVDAAVAGAWALAVCEPSGSGLGGQAVMLVTPAHGPAVVLDGHARAPQSASRALISRAEQHYGVRASTVPTMAAVLGAAHARWGCLPWSWVVTQAAELAEEGHRITPLEARQLAWVTGTLRRDPQTAAVFLPRGSAPAAGERLRQPALAATLRRIALTGTEDFYRGALARSFIADQQARAGLITAADLRRGERVQVTLPLVFRHGDRTIATAPPPSGGLTLALALCLLDRQRPAGDWDSGSWLLAVADAVRAAHALRDRLDPDDGDPVALLAELVTRFEPGRRPGSARPPAVLRAPREMGATVAPAGGLDHEPPGETTHLSVCDADGVTVALTSSIQSLFGAKVLNARLGFLYNNYLVTCPRSVGPYRLGPGCRPRSNTAPSTVTDSSGGVLVLGAAGSRRITSSLVQLVSAAADRGVALIDAMRAPRVHGLASGRIWVERPGAADLMTALESRSPGPPAPLVRVRREHDYAMGGAHAVYRDASGLVTAAADPRRDGTVRCVRWPPRERG